MMRALLLLADVAARHDESLGAFVAARLLALRGFAPRGNRVASARAAAFAAAERMIDRVHGDAAVMRTAAHPALAAGLTDRNVHVIGIRHCADGREALAEHQALLAGIEPQDHVFLVAPDDLRVGPGRTRELS